MKVSPWTGKAQCEDCQLYFTEITEYDIQVGFPPNSTLSFTFIYCPKCDKEIGISVPPQLYKKILKDGREV